MAKVKSEIKILYSNFDPARRLFWSQNCVLQKPFVNKYSVVPLERCIS